MTAIRNDIEINDENDVNTKIFRSVADVFQKAQSTYAGHRKHIAVLKKIQLKAIDQGYEDAFNYWFNKCVTKILPLKKNETVGDRIVKLIAAFVASLDRENDLINQTRGNEDTDENEEPTMFARFIDQFVRHILRGIESKDKNVRFRVIQILVVIMDNIGEIDEELYNLLIWSLKKRIYDKEALVRIQTIFCLTKFQDDSPSSPDGTLSEDDMSEATLILMKAIQNDSSPEVRRACMLNLVNNSVTRPYILERARDVNAINRRLIYSRVLKGMGKNVFEDINTSIIDKLIEWGLDDRETHVSKECGKLISHHWLNSLDGDLIQLLENLNVTTSSVTAKAMNSLFQTRPDIITKIKFPQDIWQDFTVETAFLFRCFYIYCLDNNLNEILEENFPEASKLADHLNFYITKRFRDKPDQNITAEQETETLDFVIEQLLITSNKYDFSDEVGRRATLNVIRNMLHLTGLPDELIKIGLEVLKSLSINERDFITMGIEIINDIRDDDIELQEQREQQSKNKDALEGNDDDDDGSLESFHSAVENLVNGDGTPSEQLINNLLPEREATPKTMVVCLTRSAAMLELVHTPIDQNVLITSLIDTLITPAVRNNETTIRELGIRNLGLCCLLNKDLAIENLYILGMCISKGNSTLKTLALQIIVDLFCVHGTAIVDGEGKVDSVSLHKIFYKVLKNNEAPECQVVAAEGLCKLYLADIFTDDDLFEALVLAYFSPENSHNERLVQVFAFCIPVYCFSHVSHQERMSKAAADILWRLCMKWDHIENTNHDNEGQSTAMMKPNVILQQLVYWTDPRKVVGKQQDEISKINYQLGFLLDILKSLATIEKKVIKKMLIINLNIFFITSNQNYATLKNLLELLEDIIENDPMDTTCRNSLDKLHRHLSDVIQEAMERNLSIEKSEDVDTEDNTTYSKILETTETVSNDKTADYSTIVNNTDENKGSLEANTEESITRTSEQANSRKRTRSEIEDSSVVEKNTNDSQSQISEAGEVHAKTVSFAADVSMLSNDEISIINEEDDRDNSDDSYSISS
ncbi:condensin subunit YCG1 NDAI_0C04400 [Naumovozyma dairenensis CBS 421]|uniref:Nuclear condensin complex subunit 3 C-terminal domain-containing protein n=1 Tax=Naumovozyma dairenensis (strain ATCC 10597 / BCRC 20456 / CBS 421 / NBRC 0211 / NRRL Y-12639) TaxID=1071378 RepID=G0W8I9_NAUDC|nr:hypothetical protein NDAI_0C04400 [Naumovozyma dairenensis CBS 421]CCD24100.1 hypothetical protein NDAI_0C04400 [Naumovozyma dairenensis CBS 421]